MTSPRPMERASLVWLHASSLSPWIALGWSRWVLDEPPPSPVVRVFAEAPAEFRRAVERTAHLLGISDVEVVVDASSSLSIESRIALSAETAILHRVEVVGRIDVAASTALKMMEMWLSKYGAGGRYGVRRLLSVKPILVFFDGVNTAIERRVVGRL